MDSRKKLRTAKQSGPIRFSDRIQKWYLDGPGSIALSEAEWEYIEKYEKVDRGWIKGERFLYDETGDEIPEMDTAFFAIDQYSKIADSNAKQRSQGTKQSYDF